MFEFTIHGDPIAQKQTRFSCINNRPRAYNPSSKDQERIQWQVRPFAPKEPLTGAIKLIIAFYLPIPKSTSKVKRIAMKNRVMLPCVKPDIDNLAYLITNALKKIVYEDDNQICYMELKKWYDEDPRTVIQVIPLLQMQEYGLHENNI